MRGRTTRRLEQQRVDQGRPVYRYDPEKRRRIKTVEMVEEESAWAPVGAIYLVEIGWQEKTLRDLVVPS